MPKFIFDGPTKTIEGDPSAVVGGVFSFSAQELYSEWVDWVATGDNMKYLPAFSTAGGDSLGGGTFIGAYVFIRNDLGWRGVPPDVGNVQVVIDGNFYPTDPNLPFFVPWPGVVTVIQSRVSQMTQAISTSGAPAPTASENAAAVWSRVIEGMQADEIVRILLAANVGRTTGVGTATERYKSLDGLTDRITVSFDENNNRITVNLNGS